MQKMHWATPPCFGMLFAHIDIECNFKRVYWNVISQHTVFDVVFVVFGLSLCNQIYNG